MQTTDILNKAKALVVDHHNVELNGDGNGPVTKDEVLLVWHAKVLQNVKMILITTKPDNTLYEVTYNGDKKEIYLDQYEKMYNMKFDLD